MVQVAERRELIHPVVGLRHVVRHPDYLAASTN
jgi:hypothetical protein